MEWTSQLFAEDVCNLLTKNAVRTIQNSLSSRSWSSAAARTFKNICCHIVIFPNVYEYRMLDNLETNPSNRVTRLVFNIQHENAELEQAFGEFLRFKAYEKNSEIYFKVPKNSRKTPKMTSMTKVMNLLESPRFWPYCFFTRISGLQKISSASVSFLQKHIKRGILKEVSLMQGWSCRDYRLIKNLLPQKQLVKFNSLAAAEMQFDEKALKRTLATIMATPQQETKTRKYGFRAAFGYRLEEIMLEAGFKMKRNYQRNNEIDHSFYKSQLCQHFLCKGTNAHYTEELYFPPSSHMATFHRVYTELNDKNISVNVYNDEKNTFKLTATYRM